MRFLLISGPSCWRSQILWLGHLVASWLTYTSGSVHPYLIALSALSVCLSLLLSLFQSSSFFPLSVSLSSFPPSLCHSISSLLSLLLSPFLLSLFLPPFPFSFSLSPFFPVLSYPLSPLLGYKFIPEDLVSQRLSGVVGN